MGIVMVLRTPVISHHQVVLDTDGYKHEGRRYKGGRTDIGKGRRAFWFPW